MVKLDSLFQPLKARFAFLSAGFGLLASIRPVSAFISSRLETVDVVH